MRSNLRFALVLLVSFVAATTATASAATAATAAPKVTVSPSVKLVPGHVVSVTGTHFQPRHRYTIEECSQRSFMVTMRVCNGRHAVDVKTDRNGSFRSKLTVEVCPPAAAHPKARVKTCYVGAVTLAGVDVDSLLGAAKITVKLH